MSKKLRRERKQIIVAAVLFAAVMIVDHGLHFERLMSDVGLPFPPGLLLCALYLIPYFIVGHEVVRGCVRGILNRQLMDEAFLMTLATVGAFATGEYSEAAAVMLFYSIGEWFQSYAVGKSRRSIKELMDIAPEYANIERDDGSIETADPDSVMIGDILIIKPGERIPVDATVLGGESFINTAALTGESVPRTVRPGDRVFSGCINGETVLKVRADKAYEDSTVCRILELVENASSRKSRTENFITRFARVYTPIVVLGALVLAVVPSVLTGDVRSWLLRACTFLVISCPCALVISVPLSFFGGIGAASRSGVLVKGSNYLELASRIDTLVTDKTGTLTKGEFKVKRTDCAEGVTEEELLGKAALAEGLSTHPIAASIREAAGGSFDASVIVSSENISGRGIVTVTEDAALYIGNAALMESKGIAIPVTEDAGDVTANTSTVVYVAENDRYLGAVYVADSVKDGVKEAILEMRRQGVREFVMLTGDRRRVAEAVSQALGIDRTCSELMPDEKLSAVEELLGGIRNNGVLAFVGDGINDAPSLSRADLGIAMGSMGSDAAIEAADIVIMDDRLEHIPALQRIARRTVGISKENIVFAIAVKLTFLALGALGLAGMWWAVFADVGVAIICILNSMRMLRFKAIGA